MALKPTKRNVGELRKAAVAEAFTWLNTPYVDCGYVKGPAGCVDCAMLLIGVYSAIGVVPKDFDPRPYNPDWHLHQTEELYLAGLEEYAHRVDTPEVGDVLMFKFGRHAAHGAILVAEDYVIHAYKHSGRVEFTERYHEPLASRYHSAWSPF